MAFFDWWWPIVWLVGGFLLPELIAWVLQHFFDKPGGMFSQWVWEAFAMVPHSTQRYRFLRRWSFGCFFTSLGFHLMFQVTIWLLVIYSLPGTLSVIYWWRNER